MLNRQFPNRPPLFLDHNAMNRFLIKALLELSAVWAVVYVTIRLLEQDDGDNMLMVMLTALAGYLIQKSKRKDEDD